jgi:hypothetical protein
VDDGLLVGVEDVEDVVDVRATVEKVADVSMNILN